MFLTNFAIVKKNVSSVFFHQIVLQTKAQCNSDESWMFEYGLVIKRVGIVNVKLTKA